MMKNIFTEVAFMSNHNHTEISNFRNKDCIIRVKDLINRAKELNYKGVSITDHEALSGHIDFLQHYQSLKKEGQLPEDFKIGLGNEIYLIDDLADVTENYQKGITKYWHFILIAKDRKGYEQLSQISSESAWKNWFKQLGQERVPTIKSELEDILGEDKGHLIASTACLGGEFSHWCLRYFRDGDMDSKYKLHHFIMWCINTFGKENFFLEMQPTKHLPEQQDENGEQFPQIIVNKAIVTLAKAYGLNYIITTDSHYLKEEHRAIHEAYLKADDDADRELGDFYDTTYMMSTEEIYHYLSTHLTDEDIIKGFEGTMIQHQLIEDYDLSHSVVVPCDNNIPDFKVEHLFLDYYDTCPSIKAYAFSSDIQERYFLYLCEQGFQEKKQEFNDTNIKRIDIEIEQLLSISDKIGMRLASYYTLVRGLIHNIMWKVNYVGIARGSVTGFYTCYLMGITQLNPITFNLPYWRHLSAQRPELPDIDIDTEASKRATIFTMMKEYYGYDNVLNTLTLKTEGSKSTVLTACRGLGIDNDIAQAISDMIPFERGKSWTLSECFYGNEESDRKPITEFINEVAKHEGLKEIIFMIEGLVCGRSIHASAAYVYREGYLKQNAKMKAPNGVDITALNMTCSDVRGGLKIDVLTIEGLDKLHKAVDLLCDYGYMERQPTIKETYDKYIHPDLLNYDNPEMWAMLGNNAIIDAFQMDTTMGKQACKKVKPDNVLSLAVANSLMRLMAAEGAEQPIDEYVKYKQDISLWYKEMEDWGLTQDEIAILEPHLLKLYGVADSQEAMMLLSMDEHISGFDVVEANKLRKAVAKKKAKLIESVKELFYNKGTSLGTSRTLLDYVWNVQISRQLGYSFSLNHTMPYSCICLQEMNLAYFYPKLFWNTACLTINAGADEDNANNKTTQYGKIARALGSIQSEGQKVSLPNINTAEFGFAPDVENESIIFSLKGICGIGDSIANAIVRYRPYTSLQDFLNKMELYKSESQENKFGEGVVITLIKAGCFDRLENKPRQEIMKEYIRSIIKPIDKVELKHLPLLKELDLLTSEQLSYEYRLYGFMNYVLRKENLLFTKGKSATTGYYLLEERFALPFFYEYFETNLEEGKDYEYTSEGQIAVKRGSLEREYKKLMNSFKEQIAHNPQMIQTINDYKLVEKWQEKGLLGHPDDLHPNISKWEMDSLCFYYHEHELQNIDRSKYLIENFSDLPEVGVVIDHYHRGAKVIPRFKLTRICGTVLDKDKDKHTITLLGLNNEVIIVKFYKGQFGFYDKQISEVDKTTGEKRVLEKSWFTRGNKLLITGMRRGDQFVPKKYNDSAFRHTVQLICSINQQDGSVILQSDRIGSERDEY